MHGNLSACAHHVFLTRDPSWGFSCVGRETPSVAAIVQPGSSGGFHKLFFGKVEVALPVYGRCAYPRCMRLKTMSAPVHRDPFLYSFSFSGGWHSTLPPRKRPLHEDSDSYDPTPAAAALPRLRASTPRPMSSSTTLRSEGAYVCSHHSCPHRTARMGPPLVVYGPLTAKARQIHTHHGTYQDSDCYCWRAGASSSFSSTPFTYLYVALRPPFSAVFLLVTSGHLIVLAAEDRVGLVRVRRLAARALGAGVVLAAGAAHPGALIGHGKSSKLCVCVCAGCVVHVVLHSAYDSSMEAIKTATLRVVVIVAEGVPEKDTKVRSNSAHTSKA
jgi:hypothetical protein